MGIAELSNFGAAAFPTVFDQGAPEFSRAVAGVMFGVAFCVAWVLIWNSNHAFRFLNIGLGGALLAVSAFFAADAFGQEFGDLQALIDQAQKKTEDAAPQLKSLLDEAGKRVDREKDVSADTYSALSASGAKSLANGLKASDRADIGAFGESLAKGGQGSRNAVYVAVSFSMPPEALRQVVRDAHTAGVTVVIRGLVDNSFKATMRKAVGVFQKGDLAGISIDPKVFKAFGVTSTPTFIAASDHVRACPSLDCQPTPPEFDKVEGNISLAAALKELADADGAGAAGAAEALGRLNPT